MLSFDEAVTRVTAKGQPLEIADTVIEGIDYKVFAHAPPTLRDIFASARARGDQPFLVYEGERWSFAEVMRHVDALGAALVDRYRIKVGDRVAIGMRNLPEWIVSFAAILSVGAVSVSLNAWWTEDELAYALEDSGSSLVLADPERLARMRTSCEKKGISMIGVRMPSDAAPADGMERYEHVVELGNPLPDVRFGPESDATIVYTSGTTGAPKGAVSTHRAVVQALMAFGCRQGVEMVRREPGDPGPETPAYPPSLILTVPLFHVTGCVPVMLSAFAAGIKLVIMYRWDVDKALQLIESERVTTFVGVPTQSWDLLESPNFHKYDTSSLASIAGGGAPAPPTLVHRVEAEFTGGRPAIGYGMTETNGYGPGNSGDDYISHPLSAGRVVPIMQLEVRDEDDKAVAAGERGEIWFKSPVLIRGYWNKPEATAEVLVDGWLRSGDIGHIDADGFIYVEDRAKDMVLRGGENIYCAEVEAAIYEHPAVYEAAVFGVPDQRLGEQVAAAIVVKPGATLSAAELQAHVGARLAPFKVPTLVTFSTEQLPRGATGKILKRELRAALYPGVEPAS
ncbi:MAG: class I adenylate-forming enzyme family protein [Acidimicrobiales bacterium]